MFLRKESLGTQNSASGGKKLVGSWLTTSPLYPLGTGVAIESPPTGGQPGAGPAAK